MNAKSKTNSTRTGDSKSGREKLEEVSKLLDKFFGEVPHKLEWATARNGRVGVMVTYTDFLSEPMATRMLADVLPKGVRCVLKRLYSEKVIANLLVGEYKKNKIGIVDCQEGSLTTEPIWMYVHRKLSTVEMV